MRIKHSRFSRRAVALIAAGLIICGVMGLIYWELSDQFLNKDSSTVVDAPLAGSPDGELRPDAAVQDDVAEAAAQVHPIRIEPAGSSALAAAAASVVAASTDPNRHSPIESTQPIQLPSWDIGNIQAVAASNPTFAASVVAASTNENRHSPVESTQPIQLPSWDIGDIQAIAASNPTLVAWLANWDSDVQAGQNISREQIDRLKEILKTANLSCRTLVDLGNAVQFYSGDDLSGIFFAAAAVRGDKDLAEFAPGAVQAKPTLKLMTGMLAVLWRLVDGETKLEFVPTIALINKDTVHWASADDAELAYARQHAKIGSAECVYLSGRPDDAISAAGAIDTAGMDDLELAGVGWIRGLALAGGSRYSDAIPQFQIAATNGRFDYSAKAQAMVVYCLAQLGRSKEARAALDQFANRFHPPPDQMANLNVLVRSAEMASSGR